jgi:hypothetical protein
MEWLPIFPIEFNGLKKYEFKKNIIIVGWCRIFTAINIVEKLNLVLFILERGKSVFEKVRISLYTCHHAKSNDLVKKNYPWRKNYADHFINFLLAIPLNGLKSWR